MKPRIKHKGKIYEYLDHYAGYLIYGCGTKRILVDEFGVVTHEYNAKELRRINA